MPPPTVVLPPWLQLDPAAATGRYLEGYGLGQRAGAAQTEALARQQQQMLAKQQAAELNAYRQQQQALAEREFTEKLRLDQAKAQREAQAAASQLEAQRGIQEDLSAGMQWPQALAKWAPKLFAGEPRAFAQAMEQITPPRPPVFGQTPEGVRYMQGPGGGATLVPPSYLRGGEVPQPIFGTGPGGVRYMQDPFTGRPTRIPESREEGMTEAQRQMFELRSLESERQDLGKIVMPYVDEAKTIRAMTAAELEKKPEFKSVRNALDRLDKVEKERNRLLGRAEPEVSQADREKLIQKAREKIDRIVKGVPAGPAQNAAIQQVLEVLRANGINVPAGTNAPTATAAPQASPFRASPYGL